MLTIDYIIVKVKCFPKYNMQNVDEHNITVKHRLR